MYRDGDALIEAFPPGGVSGVGGDSGFWEKLSLESK